MNNEECVDKIVEDIIDVMKEKGKTRLEFQFRIMPEDYETGIAVLELPTRMENALEANGIHTIGALAEFTTNSDSFKWKGLGVKSKGLTMKSLFLYNLQREYDTNPKKALAGIALY